MLGVNHVNCGVIAGLLTLPLSPATSPAEQAAWVACLGGAALLPDLDAPGSTIGRMWGPVSQAAARSVGFVARGHRQGTHDVVLAPIAFGLLAWAALAHPVSATAVIALTVGLVLRVFGPGSGRIWWVTNLALSTAVAWFLVSQGAQQVSLLPVVFALGVVVHIAGDAVTNEGVPISLLWMFGNRRRIGVPLFAVGKTGERLVVTPMLTVVGLLLLWDQIQTLDLVQEIGLTG